MSWAGNNGIVNLNSNYIAIIYIDVCGVLPSRMWKKKDEIELTKG